MLCTVRTNLGAKRKNLCVPVRTDVQEVVAVGAVTER